MFTQCVDTGVTENDGLVLEQMREIRYTAQPQARCKSGYSSMHPWLSPTSTHRDGILGDCFQVKKNEWENKGQDNLLTVIGEQRIFGCIIIYIQQLNLRSTAVSVSVSVARY